MDIDVDCNGEAKSVASNEVYEFRLRSVVQAIIDADRELLRDTIEALVHDYTDINSDEEYEEAIQLFEYNRLFSPAIVPDLENKVCKKWSCKYQLNFANKVCFATHSNPSFSLEAEKHTETMSLPLLPVQQMPYFPLPQVNDANSAIYFKEILKHIQNELSLTQCSLKIAVSWFTNYALFKQIKSLSEKV